MNLTGSEAGSANKDSADDLHELAHAIPPGRYLITSHVAPDADAVSSSFGLAYALSAAGSNCTVYLADPVPEKLRPLLGARTEVSSVPQANFDAVIAVDTAAKRRVGPEHEAIVSRGAKSINIDHHVSNDRWADVNYIDANAASTAQIIFKLVQHLGIRVDQSLADLLYTGLCEDTGGFRFSNTDATAFQVAGDLVRLGASPERIANLLYFSVPERVIRLRAVALANIRSAANGKIAFLVVTAAMLERAGAKSEDTEGLVDEARSIEGAVCAAMMREIENGAWKISLRSKSPKIDVNGVAALFGGGGHHAAAGCKIAGDRTEVEAKIISALTDVVNGAG